MSEKQGELKFDLFQYCLSRHCLTDLFSGFRNETHCACFKRSALRMKSRSAVYNLPCRLLLREVRAPHQIRTMWGCRQGITPTKRMPHLRSHFRNEGSCSLDLMRAQYEGI